ncbi:MAG: ATP-binding protein [Alistipes sp.]|nr:ATP-binding protein [Alistipes sp.]
MEQILRSIPDILKQDAAPSYDEILEMQVNAYNSSKGDLTGYDCTECLNKGYIAKIINNDAAMSKCRCMKIRSALDRIRKSGLENQLKTCTFKNFQTSSEWQQQMKASAFVKSDSIGFFIGGQSGCGKTHICTAMIGNFIKQGLSARYFVWREDSTILKAIVNDREYTERINEFKTADVLYIDDLFKQKDVKDADIKLAFELIDYRSRQCLKMIISTELDENALIDCDEGLAGRIFQMSKGFRTVIAYDRNRNYRLRKE